jgi:Gliding motility associated protein GldN
MRLFIHFFLFYFWAINSSAQSAFLSDPEIVWAAEIEQDWNVDLVNIRDEHLEGLTTLKLLRTERNEPHWHYPHLAHLVYAAAKSKKLPIFKDPECKIPVEAIDAYPGTGVDTIVTFNPETYEEKLELRPKEYNIEGDFVGWRLRQILFYNAKKAIWGTKVVAVAPLMNITKGDSIAGKKPIFWFKADEKPQKTSSNSIVWAKKTLNKQDATKVPVLPDKLLKISNDFRNPAEDFLIRMKNDPKMTIYDPNNESPLTQQDRIQLMAPRRDTVVTFDPETYEEKVIVVQNELNPDNIEQLRLVQHWYWDERRGRLSITLEAVGLLIKVFDDFGEYRYSRLLCYRRVK